MRPRECRLQAHVAVREDYAIYVNEKFASFFRKDFYQATFVVYLLLRYT